MCKDIQELPDKREIFLKLFSNILNNENLVSQAGIIFDSIKKLYDGLSDKEIGNIYVSYLCKSKMKNEKALQIYGNPLSDFMMQMIYDYGKYICNLEEPNKKTLSFLFELLKREKGFPLLSQIKIDAMLRLYPDLQRRYQLIVFLNMFAGAKMIKEVSLDKKYLKDMFYSVIKAIDLSQIQKEIDVMKLANAIVASEGVFSNQEKIDMLNQIKRSNEFKKHNILNQLIEKLKKRR
jgi:hypothetical protein